MLQVGNIQIAPTKSGGRKLVHSGGKIVIETAAQVAAQRAELLSEVAQATAQLAAFDAMAISVGKETAVDAAVTPIEDDPIKPK